MPKRVIAFKPNQPTYRILVVDDRWENRQIVMKLLQPFPLSLIAQNSYILGARSEFNKMAKYLAVEYTYEQVAESSTIDITTNSSFLLDPTSLENMSSEWLTQLEKAAAELDEDAVSRLIEQIPREYSLLAQALKNKADDFDFDEIVDLVQRTVLS